MSNAVKMDKYEQLAYARRFIHRGAVVNYPENEVIFIKDFPNERWKVIPGFNGKYLISDMGNVYSTSKCKIMKKRLNQHGYYDIGLDLNNHNKTKRIHRLVAEAFVPNPQKLNVINHIDGNKRNNNADNLEWCSYKFNARHAVDNELIKAQKIICVDTGEIFQSPNRCSEKYGSRTHLLRCIEAGKQYKGLTFRFYNEQIGGNGNER